MKIAHKSCGTAGAERTGDGTADLCAEAESHASVLCRNQSTFHGLAVKQRKQKLAGTVRTLAVLLDFDCGAEEVFFDFSFSDAGRLVMDAGSVIHFLATQS